ncbi:MAG: efflux RND transporter periplasmic adaptor subunit [Bacteroidota bacterium]
MKPIIAAALIAVTILSSCSHEEKKAEASKGFVLSDTMMHMISIDTVHNCNIGDEVTLSGEVSFNENNIVKIYPRNSGQVVDAKVSLGDKVSKGQVLATVKSADIAGNYSDLSSANADVSIAKRAMENTESLFKNGISSEREYNEAKQNYQKALSARNKIQSVLNINGGSKTTEGGQYVLIAPMDGYIVEKKITAGSFIRADMGDYLFTISNLKNVWVYANVYEADIQKVKEGYPVSVTTLAYPDKIFQGKIDKVSEVLDPQSKAMRVRVTLSNDELLLKPDMFARVIVNNEEGSRSLCIPTSALISQDGKNFVVVYNSKDNVKIAEVNILKTVGAKTYIKDGVSELQKVVTKNQLLIFNQLLSN